MNTRRLLAAISEVRAKLSLVESFVEHEDYDRALAAIADVQESWSRAMEELRAA